MRNEIENKEQGNLVNVGDYWFMDASSEVIYKEKRSWVMRIKTVQSNGLVPVEYVNWKRSGGGVSYSRMKDDFGKLSNLRKATKEEVDYFNKRWEKLN